MLRKLLARLSGWVTLTPPETPSTLNVEKGCSGLNRPEVFDPALKHFPCALRAGEPAFADGEMADRWQHTRLQVMHHILDSLAAKSCAKDLILRGSAVMATWFGDAARRPGDLDFVVTPSSLAFDSPESVDLIRSVLGALDGSLIEEGLWIPENSFATEEIWTYEKAPGQRVVVPWLTEDRQCDGTIQLDFVFGEEMPSSPHMLDIHFGDFSPVPFLVASMELSLAWKLVWLVSDSYAMGKDLYDAVLLAEAVTPPLALLRDTFAAAKDGYWDPFQEFVDHRLDNIEVEWEEFSNEYPGVGGTAAEFQSRLNEALEPVWVEMSET